jgi:hypothetical protein
MDENHLGRARLNRSYDFVSSVTLTAGKVEQFLDAHQDRASIRGPDNSNSAPASEVE